MFSTTLPLRPVHSHSCLLPPLSFHLTCTAGEEDEEALAAAAAAATKPASPYLERAKANGFAPPNPAEEDLMYTDPAILSKPTGFGNLEATRLKAVEALKDDSIPEKDRATFERFMAGMFRSFLQEECEGRATGLRKGVQQSLTDINRYNPAAGQEVIVINETPNKVALAATKLDEECIHSDSYAEAFGKLIEQGVKCLTAPREAGSSRPGEPSTPSMSTTVEEDLRRLLQQSVQNRKVKTSSDFGLYCAIAMDKLQACIKLAERKKDYKTAYQLGKKAEEVTDRVKQFLLMTQSLGFTKARELYLAIGNPFSSMQKEHWDLLSGVATDNGFKEALEKVFGGFPDTISKPLKRRRADDSDEESEGSPRPKKLAKKVITCSYCGKRGHAEAKCYQKRDDRSKKGKKK